MPNNPPRRIDIKGQDHMLAYITPEEGDVLQSLGGSGAPGPMGIPSFFDTGEGTGGYGGEGSAEGTTTDDYSDSGRGSFSDDQAAANKSVTDGYLSNYGLTTFGPDTVDRNQQMAGILGITPTNPFGYQGFFSKTFGLDPESIDYTNIFGNQADMDAIAQKNVDVYSNPNNTPGMPGFDKNQPPNQPRSGIQRGFGSLFNPVGQQTAYGKIAAQRPKDPMGSLAMGIFSNLAGLGLPSLMAQGIGRDTYAAKGTPGYDATIDPASPSYAGATSMGGIMDALSVGTTGMTSTTAQEAYGAVKDAIKDAYGYLSTAGKN